MSKAGIYKETAEDALGSKLFITAYRVVRHAEQSLAEFGVTFHSYLVLYYIEKIPRASIKELTNLMQISQPIVSRTVQMLEKKSYVHRSASKDGRTSELSLSGEGRRTLKKMNGKLNEVSFVLRHQPDFRIVQTEEQLNRIIKAIEVAKERPLINRPTKDKSIGESVLVRLRG